MRISLLIVDDEPVICQGLATTLPWDKLDVDIKGIAHNGEEALEIFEKYEIDLVLTDVYMPVMDGLELTKKIKEKSPKTKVILFSGYDEFEYARQAMRLDVIDYLLKPVDVDELIKLIQQLKKEMKEEKKEEKQSLHDFLMKVIFHYLLNTPIAPNEKKKIDHLKSSYRLVISQVQKNTLVNNHCKKKDATFKQKWKQTIHCALNKEKIQTISLFSHDNELVTLCFSDSPHLLKKNKMIRCLRHIKTTENFSLKIGLSSLEENFHNLAETYHSVSTNLDRKTIFFKEKHQIFFLKEEEKKENTVSSIEEIEELIIEGLFNKNNKYLNESLQDLFQTFYEKRLSMPSILSILQKIERALVHHFQQIKLGYTLDQISLHFQKEIDTKAHNTITAIYHLFLTDLQNMRKVLHQQPDHHWVIRDIKKYMQENFTKDLKAIDVANDHYITPSYFSRLFKEETGYSFSEYLNKLRIQESCLLLKNTPYKIYEIANKVGYREYKYFARVFKKYTGLTPTEYRHLHVQKAE